VGISKTVPLFLIESILYSREQGEMNYEPNSMSLLCKLRLLGSIIPLFHFSDR